MLFNGTQYLKDARYSWLTKPFSVYFTLLGLFVISDGTSWLLVFA